MPDVASPKIVQSEIATRADALMSALGIEFLGQSLQSLGWTFLFDRARRRIGNCAWRKGSRSLKRISLSRHFAEELPWARLEDVVRHEIAHALDFESRNRSAHDAVWREWAVRCGADPTRLYEGGVPSRIAPRYVGMCPQCGAEYPFFRKLKRPHACVACCNAYNRGRYSGDFELALKPVKA